MDKPLANRSKSRAAYLGTSAVDVVVLALTAPFLLATGWAPRPLSLAAVALLAIPVVVRRGRTGRFSRPMALNRLVVALAIVFLPAAMLLSPAPWTVSWPRAATLTWSMALFYALANWPALPRAQRSGWRSTRLNGPTWAFLAVGGLVALLAPLAPLAMRSVDKLFFLPQTSWLATRLGWEHGLPTNEVAGVLTLFVPFAVALAAGAWWTRRRRLLAALVPLVLLLLVALTLTQSRTGLTASAAGTLLALLLGARPRRKTLAIGLGVIVLLLAAAMLSPLREWFVFAGANSWQSVVGPRLGIWGQALDGVRDHPVWGMGLGTFGLLARLVYPLVPIDQSAVIEDAHNLYLQTALDFGVLGGLLLLLLLGVAAWSGWHLARSRPPRALSRLWAAGLVGALGAHALYSLTDAVALGTLGSVALWYVFGLIMGGMAGHTQRAVDPFRRWSPLVVAVAGLALLSVLIFAARPVNRAGQLAGLVLLNPSRSAATAAAAAEPLTAARCRAGWYEGLLLHEAGDTARRSTVWANLLACTADYTGYMAVLAHDDAALAQQAIALRPDDPAAYFWLAGLYVSESPDEAIALYQQGLALAPGDGRRWLALAELLDSQDEDGALAAYLQTCRHGDPGANGCARAAAIVAARGDLETAIRYYRLSNWSEAQTMADELERQIDP